MSMWFKLAAVSWFITILALWAWVAVAHARIDKLNRWIIAAEKRLTKHMQETGTMEVNDEDQ